MNVSDLLYEIYSEARNRAYFTKVDLLARSSNLLKARLYITPDLFVQIYRNDHFQTTNLVLIHNQQRIYARDELNGHWHRHPMTAPRQHDTSSEGCRAVTFSEFLDEVETVLTTMNLP